MEEVSIQVGVAEAVAMGTTPSRTSVFDRISSALMYLTVALMPFVFYSAATLPIEFAKNSVLVSGISLATIAWVFGRLVTGRKLSPKSGIIAASIVLFIALAIVGLFSNTQGASIVGIGNESGTLMVLGALVFSLVLGAIHASRSESASFRFPLFILVAGIIVLAAQILHVAFGAFAPLGNASGNLIGKWNDLAGFYGLVTAIGLMVLELGAVAGASRVLAWAGLVAGLLGLIFTNFSLAWILVGLISLALLVWGLVFGTREEGEPRAYHIAPAIILVISVLFALFGSADRFVGSGVFRLQERFGVSTLEARPSWDSTYTVTRRVLEEYPVFGIGLNRFAEAWARYKPAPVNETLFWNTNFGAGVGWIPSFVATGGIVAGAAWAIFLIAVIVAGAKLAFRRPIDAVSLSLYLSSLYLWAFAFFYVPDTFMILLAFTATGMLVGRAAATGVLPMREVRIFSRPSLRFGIVLAMVVFILFVVIGGSFEVARAYAFRTYSRGVAVINAGESLDTARALVATASKTGRQDLYDRTLSEIDVLKLQRTIATPSLSQEELRTDFEQHLSRAIASARQATERDSQNHLNWVALGRVYMAVVAPPLSIEGAYEFAREALDRGLQLTPTNPSILLERARLEVARGNLAEARKFIGEAIEAKSNFAQAHFLLSQLEATEGNLKAAIRSAEQTALLSPQDVGAFFQLGLLRYQNEDYRGTVEVLERAAQISPSYSNARYFLGLAYAELDRDTEAIAQFEVIRQFNPDNDEVARILRNLKSGRRALSGVASPLDRDDAPFNE